MKRLSNSERKHFADLFEGLIQEEAERLEQGIVEALERAEQPSQTQVELAKIKSAHSLKVDLIFCSLLVALAIVFFGG